MMKFVLPEVTGKIRSAESGNDADSQVHSMSSTSEEDSCDDAENEDSRKLKENRNNSNDNPDENILFSSVISSQRSKKDLIKYSLFFKELENLYSQLSLTWTITEQPNDQDIKYSKDERKMHEAKFKQLKVMSEETKLIENNVNINKNYETDLKRVSAISTNVSNEHAYCALASMVKSVINFVKVAYPDLIGGDSLGKLEPLNAKDRKVCRSKLLACADRALRFDNLMQETAYDLDALTMNNVTNGKMKTNDQLLCNWDLKRIGKHTNDSKQLHFESRFESGNLRKAIQIAPREYDLILTPDVNSGSRHQWFYFEVSNMEKNVPYTFNIINCEKTNSQFNFGMKPLLFSVTEAQLGNIGWVRAGVDICYYRNYYQQPSKEKNYLTTSFTITFPHSYDVCYLAYHFPYTYTQLLINIWKWSKKQTLEDIYFKVDTLCNTLNGNENPLVTITSPESKGNLIKNRKIIFLTSRVHPGESNASWMMHGTLETLLGSSTYARSLRDDYVFKVIPMLNIEGVINGCNRYGLTNEDLNRRWSNPNQVLHPVIYHTKGLMEYCTRVLQRPPHVFVDYHGHSRRKNVFLFGCSTSGSWSAADKSKLDKPLMYLMLPHLMQKFSPAFALPLCSFKVERNKESTARVAIWRQLGVWRSYTMESSFCGCDQGSLAGYHFDIKHLRKVGQDFCQALSMMEDGVEEWSIDKLPVNELRNYFMHDSRLGVELCCPLKCILQKSKRSSKCIQDKHEKHHFVGLP
ncbi:cytosolic carboxypeptidase 1 isoform X2 [Cephus cinctus]|uniref:Cytosolic carboxypeptidase 1 isoform X2 n=1 Tax=Cephus cinctus TaxID=211228 RepID=A0AAJ7CBZ4_CEPCN|nr:cytosolic carboxypeptidase 1 isoform X2 [Cephus cinctus]